MKFEPELLHPWVELVNYEGRPYSDYYIAAQRFFRCSPIERMTYDYIREHMLDDDCKDDGGVIEVTSGDECLIARYQILVHKYNARALRRAEMFVRRQLEKGYVDPETADMYDPDAHDDPTGRPPQARPPMNAPEASGRYIAIPIMTGNSGGSVTTFSTQRKSHARAKEKAAILREAAAITALGGEVNLVARPLDRINRRWKGVKPGRSDETPADPVES